MSHLGDALLKFYFNVVGTAEKLGYFVDGNSTEMILN